MGKGEALAKTGNWRSMTIRSLEGNGEMISSRRSTKGTGAPRSGTGGGGERAGMRWEMVPRLLSARIPRENRCNTFRRYRNLDVREKTTWNIVDCRVESLRVQSAKCEVYIRWRKQYDGETRYIYQPAHR